MTVSVKLLRRYIRLSLDEAYSARVPQQLLPSDQGSGETEEETPVDQVSEFCGTGAGAGYSAPLGMDPDRLGRQKNKRNK